VRPCRNDKWTISGLFAVFLTSGCETARQPPEGAEGAANKVAVAESAPVAVSSPYLEAAIRDVLRRDVSLVRLAGPAMCPGHFDMRPSQITDLAKCRLLNRTTETSPEAQATQTTKLSIVSPEFRPGVHGDRRAPTGRRAKHGRLGRRAPGSLPNWGLASFDPGHSSPEEWFWDKLLT
jgi:hypothetical protein